MADGWSGGLWLSDGGDGPDVSPDHILAWLLESRAGQIVSQDRLWRMDIALKPVIRAYGLRDISALARNVYEQPDGPLALASVNALLNNETRFFRDPAIFATLGDEVLPLLAGRAVMAGGGVVRIWCAGCSTGQEAYSLAMLLRAMQDRWRGVRFHIVATDISTDAIRQAKSGLFSQAEVQRGLPVNHLLRWFAPDGAQWRIHDELVRMIDFRVGNLLADDLWGNDASPDVYDLLLCRNVLLYFARERQREIIGILAGRSARQGYLLLGAGETLIGQGRDFIASRRFRGMYERAEG